MACTVVFAWPVQWQQSPLRLPAAHKATPRTPPGGNTTVFVNAYIHPTDLGKQQNGFQILRRQLEQMRASPAWAGVRAVRVVSIGARLAGGCGDRCGVLRHVDRGTETVTLGELYKFCAAAPPGASVAYVHNKGSFHASKKNTRFREMLMRALFHGCLVADQAQCNVCGARFSPQPHAHMPGNMWIAKCAHVRRLRPPAGFAADMAAVAEAEAARCTARLAARGRTSSVLLGKNNACRFPGPFMGTGRYAAEHWIASHPNSRPCDVYDGPYSFGYAALPPANELWQPKLSHVPQLDTSRFFDVVAAMMCKQEREKRAGRLFLPPWEGDQACRQQLVNSGASRPQRYQDEWNALYGNYTE